MCTQLNKCAHQLLSPYFLVNNVNSMKRAVRWPTVQHLYTSQCLTGCYVINTFSHYFYMQSSHVSILRDWRWNNNLCFMLSVSCDGQFLHKISLGLQCYTFIFCQPCVFMMIYIYLFICQADLFYIIFVHWLFLGVLFYFFSFVFRAYIL